MGRKTRAETSLKGVVTFIIVLRIFAGEIQTILIHAIENPIRGQKIRCIDQLKATSVSFINTLLTNLFCPRNFANVTAP